MPIYRPSFLQTPRHSDWWPRLGESRNFSVTYADAAIFWSDSAYPKTVEVVSERPEIPKMSASDKEHYQDCVVILAAIFQRGPMLAKMMVSAMLRTVWESMHGKSYPQR